MKDATEKYTRTLSTMEVVPTAARKTYPNSSSAPYGYGEPRDEQDENPHQALETPFARPAFVPLHERWESPSPTYEEATSGSPLQGPEKIHRRHSSFYAEMRRPVADFTVSENKYELAMTRHWRRRLREGDSVTWDQVQDE